MAAVRPSPVNASVRDGTPVRCPLDVLSDLVAAVVGVSPDPISAAGVRVTHFPLAAVCAREGIFKNAGGDECGVVRTAGDDRVCAVVAVASC